MRKLLSIFLLSTIAATALAQTYNLNGGAAVVSPDGKSVTITVIGALSSSSSSSGGSSSSGSSSSSSSSGSSSSGASSTSSSSSSSSGGSVIPPASSLTDPTGTQWTVASGVVMSQAKGASAPTSAGFTQNVVALALVNNVIYQENASCLWWNWSNSAWVLATKPVGVVVPACPASSSSSSSGSSSSSSSSSGVAATFGIKVVGSTFADLSGNVLQLQGENVTGIEISYANNMWDAYYTTSVATWTAIKNAWHMNIIRLPINEYDWNANVSSAKGVPYQTIYKTAVANITAAGMYVIADLHWAAPNGYKGGVADGQPGYIDADNGPRFWSSIASTFKNNPAVLFELFNEPYGTGSVDNNLLKNGGGPVDFYDQAQGKGGGADTGVKFTVAGHQQLVNAIRTAGATNVILYSCPSWDSQPSASLAVKPTDPLNQLGATVHYANGSNADYSSIQAAGVPIIMTEFYTLAGRGGYPWAKTNHIGYVMWGANTWNGPNDLSFLINNSPWSYNGASVAWQ
jgi:endoglucanase